MTSIESNVCPCGKNHTLPIKDIVIDRNALEHLAGCREKLALGKRAFLIADLNTMEIAGRDVERLLTADGCQVKTCLFHTKEKIIPDERALIKVLGEFDPDIDFMVAVGSGTINDLARFIGSKVNKPYLSVPTAPSMDGITSVVAPLVINGFKKSWPATYPLAVYADLQILREAPREMIAAGFGDLLGKITGRADWVLSRIINGEYYCQQAVDLVQRAVDDCILNIDRLAVGDEQAIKSLTQGLIDAGIAMLWVGNSRPASGSEHLIAQFWEMKSIERGEFKHFHGSEVAVATVIIAKIYQKLLLMNFEGLDLNRTVDLLPDRAQWEERVVKVYGPMAGDVFTENRDRSFAKTDRRHHLEKVVNSMSQWRESIRPLMITPEKMVELLQKVGCPHQPSQLDLDRERTREGILASQDSRMRYTILEAAEELGCLEQIADEIVTGIE